MLLLSASIANHIYCLIPIFSHSPQNFLHKAKPNTHSLPLFSHGIITFSQQSAGVFKKGVLKALGHRLSDLNKSTFSKCFSTALSSTGCELNVLFCRGNTKLCRSQSPFCKVADTSPFHDHQQESIDKAGIKETGSTAGTKTGLFAFSFLSYLLLLKYQMD